MNTAAKYMLNNYLRALKNAEKKWCTGTKWVISRLNIRAFISFYNGSFACLIFKHEDIFFILAIIYIVDTAMLSRISPDCVFLGCTLNKIFVLFEMPSQYIATVIIRGVFRTESNMMETFVKIGNEF